MKRRYKKEDHKLKPGTVEYSKCMADAMKHYSKKIPGCPRPQDGSINHFVQYALHYTLINFCDLDLGKFYPEHYQTEHVKLIL